MAVTQRLDLRQSQSLVMTPQLQQAIKLLQLSNLELAAYVEQELERNPLLERDEGNEGEDEDRAAAREPADGDARALAERGAEPPDSAALSEAGSLPPEAEAPLDTDYEDLYDSAPGDAWASAGGQRAARARGDFDGEAPGPEQQASEPASLRQHLLEQLQMDLRDPAERMIGVHLIEMLDDAGYLAGDLAQVAEALGCDPARVEATLIAMQRFDPPGIFARSLRECLALQLADRDRLDPAMEIMLDHLLLVARCDLPALRRLCGLDDEDLVEMLAEIRALDPKPALAYDFALPEPIVPDILMRRSSDGGWIIELNNDTLPRVLINQHFYARISGRARSKADRDYLSAQFQTANWLVRSLQQRANTILKVAGEIVRQQDGFLRKGVQHLRPLTLRAVAEAIEMHESTVSRVTSNKYIATPRGIYELKYFFTSAIAGADGIMRSAESVRQRIKSLIAGESAETLSDDRIVAMLRAEGVDIARRTVAKYREAMRIPSSVERRRFKAAGA